MPKKKKASILAGFAPESYLFIVAYLIGFARMVYLQHSISYQGIAVYAYAFELYNVLYLLASGMLASASKGLIHNRSSKGQIRNRDHIFSYMLLRGLLASAVCMAVFLLFGNIIAQYVIGYKLCGLALQGFAFAFVPACLLCCMQSYFEGARIKVPSYFAKLLCEVGGFIATIILCKTLVSYGQKVSKLLLENNRQFAFGSLAAAVSDGIGYVVGLLFLVGTYFILHGLFRSKRKEDQTRNNESSSQIFRICEITTLQMMPSLLCTCCTTLIMQCLYLRLSHGKMNDKMTKYGAYYCMIILVLKIFSYIAELFARHLQKALKHYSAIDDLYRFRMRFSKSLKGLLICFMPFVVYIAMFAKQIMMSLYTGKVQSFQVMVQVGILCVLLQAIRMMYQTVILVKGKKQYVYLSMYAGMLAQIVSFILFFTKLKEQQMGLVYSLLISSLIECLLSYMFAGRCYRLKTDLIQVVVLPIAGGLVLALLDLGIASFLSDRLGNYVTLLIGFIVTFGLYYAYVFLLSLMKKRDVLELPFGNYLQYIAALFGVRE